MECLMRNLEKIDRIIMEQHFILRLYWIILILFSDTNNKLHRRSSYVIFHKRHHLLKLFMICDTLFMISDTLHELLTKALLTASTKLAGSSFSSVLASSVFVLQMRQLCTSDNCQERIMLREKTTQVDMEWIPNDEKVLNLVQKK